jgi:hypothetical protein
LKVNSDDPEGILMFMSLQHYLHVSVAIYMIGGSLTKEFDTAVGFPSL